jgi:transposase
VISVEDWAEIRRLYRAEGLSIRQIARMRDVSRNTVRAAVRSDGPPRYARAAKHGRDRSESALASRAVRRISRVARPWSCHRR